MTVFEEKSIGKAILRLGFPAILAQLATLIYNTADTYIQYKNFILPKKSNLHTHPLKQQQ